MFSFRELVESMEEKTCKSGVPILCSTQLPSSISIAVPKDCEKSARKQTSQYRTETIDDKAEGGGRHEGFWEYNESQKNLEQRNRVSWEEAVLARGVAGQGANTQRTDTESPQIIQKEMDALLTSKHCNLTLQHQNLSFYDLCDATIRNGCTMLQKTSASPDLANQCPLLVKQNLDPTNTSLRFKHQLFSTAQSSKCGSEYIIDQDQPTQISHSLNKDKNPQAGNCPLLKTKKRIVCRMVAKCKTKGCVCRAVKQRHSLTLSDKEINVCEEVTNVSSIDMWKIRSDNNSQISIPQDLHFQAAQNPSHYVKICCQETSAKEKATLTQHPESYMTATKGSCSNDLSSFVTDALPGSASAMQLPADNQDVHSNYHRNTSGYSHQTKDEHEGTSCSLQDHKAGHMFEGFNHASKQGGKDMDMIRGASPGEFEFHCSELAAHVSPSSLSPENNRKKIVRSASNKKRVKEIGDTSIRGLYNGKMHKTRRSRRSKTQGHVVPASTGDNQGSRASSPSPSGFRCQLCSSWWRDEASLARHQRLHAPERPYSCQDCPSRFNQLVHLQIHRRTHTGEKPFRCGACNASFNRKDRLRSHERRHSGELPYTCPYCSASFRDASSLRDHILGHAYQPPFTCRLCSATFAHLATFTSHWRLHN